MSNPWAPYVPPPPPPLHPRDVDGLPPPGWVFPFGPPFAEYLPGGGVPWTPNAVAWDVSAGNVAGLNGVYSAATGGTLVTTDGTRVNGWTNVGTLGGRMGNLTGSTGPVLRTNSGVPYLEFTPSGLNGRALGLDITSTTSGNMTVAFLFRYNAGAATSRTNTAVWTTLGSAQDDAGRLGAQAVNFFSGHTTGYDSTDGSALANSRNPFVDYGWHILTWRRTAGSPSTWECWLDNRLIHTGTTVNTASGLARWNICGPMYGEGLLGDAAAFHAIRGTVLSTATINQLNAYYMNHPLITAQNGKVVVWCGDSVSTPQNAVPNADGTGTWDIQYGTVRQVSGYLRTNSGLGRLYNQSRGGWSTSQFRSADELATATYWLNQATSKKILVIATGVNDIRSGGAGLTPAQSYAQMLGLKSDLESTVPGLVTVIGTIQDGNPVTYPSVSGTPFTTLVATLNGLITAGAVANGYTACDLTGTVPGRPWGAVGRGGVLTADNDGLHPIQSGMTALADVWSPAIAAVM